MLSHIAAFLVCDFYGKQDREGILAQETISGIESDMRVSPELLRFLDEALPESVRRHEAGFYFEEGGCWAFAIALSEFLEKCGIRSSIQVMKGYRHAFVLVNGMLVDHQGVVPATRFETAKLPVEDIAGRGIAGCGRERFEADLAWADEIIRDAAEGCPA